jgi:S-adenosylmethionine decarboxylase
MNWIRKSLTLFCLLVAGALSAENQETSPYQFKGVHFLVSYCDCDMEALTDVQGLELAMYDAVEKCGATILKSCSQVFPPNGLTMVILLSESHASIHTYPEHGKCHVDLFTCGDRCSAKKFDEAMRAYLKPKTVCPRTLIRQENICEQHAL